MFALIVQWHFFLYFAVIFVKNETISVFRPNNYLHTQTHTHTKQTNNQNKKLFFGLKSYKIEISKHKKKKERKERNQIKDQNNSKTDKKNWSLFWSPQIINSAICRSVSITWLRFLTFTSGFFSNTDTRYLSFKFLFLFLFLF